MGQLKGRKVENPMKWMEDDAFHATVKDELQKFLSSNSYIKFPKRYMSAILLIAWHFAEWGKRQAGHTTNANEHTTNANENGILTQIKNMPIIDDKITEERLLIIELFARLPYGVIVQDRNGTHVLTPGNTELGTEYIKPYLRPISSMTNEEKGEYMLCISMTKARKGDALAFTLSSAVLIDWLYTHHLDFRGLIPKGLALEAPKDMYKTEQNMNKEEAINVVRCNWPEGRHQLSEALKTLIPEFQESEDEKITAEIVDFISRNAERGDDIMKSAGWIAYLEKQKEYIEDIRQYAYNKGLVDAEQKPVKTHDYTEVGLDRALQIIKDAKGNLHGYQSDDGIYECDHAIQTLERILKNGIEQEPAEWSDEDESYLQTVINEMEANKKEAREYEHKKYDTIILWLNSLRPQPQRKDTYYDIIHDILATLKDMDFMKITPEHRVSLLNDIRVKCKNADECAAILDEPHWKPSEEQMKALKLAYEDALECPEGCVPHLPLKDLYSDLQKLL